jgi:hypothetical protein
MFCAKVFWTLSWTFLVRGAIKLLNVIRTGKSTRVVTESGMAAREASCLAMGLDLGGTMSVHLHTRRAPDKTNCAEGIVGLPARTCGSFQQLEGAS